MKLKIQSIHFDADVKLIDFVEQKVDKLLQYYSDIINGEVFLKIDRSAEHLNKVVEIKIMAPGKTHFAKEQANTFEQATDNAVDALRRQIKKHKEKIRRSM